MAVQPSNISSLAEEAQVDGQLSIPSWLAPARMAIAGVAVYLGVFLLSPLEVTVEPSLSSWLYLATAFAAFLLGCMAHGLHPRSLREAATKKWSSVAKLDSSKLFGFVMLVSSIGMCLRLYDRFVIRGLFVAQDVMAKRETLSAVGSNVFSIGAALLYPFCYLTLFAYFLLARDGKRRPILFLLAVALFLFPSFDALMIGARSTVLMSMSLLVLYLIYFKKLRLRIRTVFASLVGVILAAVFSGRIFLDRLNAMGLDASFSIYNSQYAFTVQPRQWVTEILQNTDSPLLFQIVFGYLHLCQYVTHGVFEFTYLFDHFNDLHTWGSTTFYVYYKMVALSFGSGFREDIFLAAQPRSGIYTTFFGPIFVDFGWAGPAFMFILGIVAQYLYVASNNKRLEFLPMYLYLAIIVFFMPVVNLIQNAEGLYVVTAFLAFSVAYGLFHSRKPA